MPPCLALSIIRYGSRIKWSNAGKGVVPSPATWCSCYEKGAFGSSSTIVANIIYLLYIYIYIYIYSPLLIIYIHQQLHRSWMRQKVNFSRGISKVRISFASSSLKSTVCFSVHSLAEGRITGFIPSARLFALWEMHTTFSSSWTWIDMSFSYESNHYTTNTIS